MQLNKADEERRKEESQRKFAETFSPLKTGKPETKPEPSHQQEDHLGTLRGFEARSEASSQKTVEFQQRLNQGRPYMKQKMIKKGKGTQRLNLPRQMFLFQSQKGLMKSEENLPLHVLRTSRENLENLRRK